MPVQRPTSCAFGGPNLDRLYVSSASIGVGESDRSAQPCAGNLFMLDTGIGGRVAEAVGGKLKTLSASQQVLCVTHQPQVASQADRHFVVEKSMTKNRTSIAVRELASGERIEEIARMLAGERITDAARENARELIAAAG